MLIFNFGYYEFWEPYDPDYLTGPGAPAFGPQKVTFDGVLKEILINYGETDINIRTDIYSAWKEWSEVRDNSKFLFAMSAIGGDPITDVTNVGITYFLENGWRIRPYVDDYILSINGNVYTREAGEDPVLPALGDANITVNLTRSNLVDIVQTASSALTTGEKTILRELHRLAGLDVNNPMIVDPTSRTAGADINLDVDKDIGTDTVTVTRSNTDPVPSE